MTSPNGFTKTMVQKSALAMLLLPGIACSQAKQAAAPSGPAAAAASEAPQDLPETESVHILTGRSVVINLQTKVKRIYVSNPAVLESVTSSPLQVVLTAKAPGSCNVMLWDVDGHTRLLDV
ncbi:MAG: pilus assembly protein N-terminal domain-containing protein, partial [Acidobacteriota bacterium]|nr:pilus assembly protein N-terminal domain-containing protein [Acidobacteriota bacterium]